MKVAVGMMNEKMLTDDHFGESEFYLIFKWDGNNWKLLERRENKAKTVEERMHGDPRKFKAVIAQLEDVDVLLAYRMGPNIKRIIEHTNKIPIVTKNRELEKALNDLTEKLKARGLL